MEKAIGVAAMVLLSYVVAYFSLAVGLLLRGGEMADELVRVFFQISMPLLLVLAVRNAFIFCKTRKWTDLAWAAFCLFLEFPISFAGAY